MKRTIPLLVGLLALAAMAAADLVVTRDGAVHEGTVTTMGDRVLVKTATGETIELDAANVLRISKLSATSAPAAAPASAPAGPPAASQQSAPAPASVATGLPQVDFSEMDRPECYAFITMRQMASATLGADSASLRQAMEQFQAMAHDRKRRADGEWRSPQDFASRRKMYEAKLKEAADALARNKDKTAGKADCNAKLRQASRMWLDPTVRQVLIGIEAYQTGDFRAAADWFRQCAANDPYLPLLRQGAAISLIETKQPLEALEHALELMKLAPDAVQSYELVVDAMKKTPGSDIRKPLYAQAEAMVAQYAKPASSYRSSLSWLMPGRQAWTCNANSLPVPPYDRLSLRQAAAVPIAPHTLLVDLAAVDGADDIYVRVEANRLVPATLRRLDSSVKTPLAMLHVADYEFTPVGVDKKDVLAGDSAIATYAMGLYPSLGQTMRKATGRITSVDEKSISVNLKLSPGEGAAPLLTDEGVLAGFLAGKTDAFAAGGGQDAIIHRVDILQIIAKASSSYSGVYGGYSRAKRTITTQKATGSCFAVLSVTGESLSK